MRARRWWGWPLVPFYAAGLAVRDWMWRKGWVRVRRLEWPVISVGSLSAGGAGKTPVVIALAELLRTQGLVGDVLSRGYGRTGVGVERVNLGVADAARRFGDEPVVIAQSSGAAVWVGADRYAVGAAAERSAARVGEADSQRGVAAAKEGPGLKPLDFMNFIQGAEAPCSLRKAETPDRDGESASGESHGVSGTGRRVHLLDDGFQHWGLGRAVDVVLVTEEDLEDALLPAGNRRERLGALSRADVVVLREEERERVKARVRPLMREGAEVWCVRRELRFPDSLGGLEARVRPLAFCAIARPKGFYAMLVDAGFDLAGTVDFADHHAYTLADMERISTKAKESGATGFITTEKDAVKLTGSATGSAFHFASGLLIERLQTVGPVCVVALEARFVDETDVMRGLEARLR